MEFVGIDKFSLLDYGDNVCVVLFAPTCNYRCPFCHNGDSVLNSNAEIPFEDILNYLKERKGLVDAVVISGGEPTLMNDLAAKIKQIKELGYKIKLDSNGTNPEIIKALIHQKLIDYVAMDIKNSEEKYSLTCGAKNPSIENVKKSIKLLMTSGIDYEFRTTLVKELHNSDDIKSLGELIKGAKVLYLQKFVDREGVIEKGLHPINEEEANSFKQILVNYVKEVNLRGY